MGLKKYLENQPYFTIDLYNKREHIKEDCVPFEGSPRQHPYDHDKLILVTEPFSPQATIYEFKMTDIEAVEDLASMGTAEGDTISMVRLWVRKHSFGLRMEPFQVHDKAAEKKNEKQGNSLDRTIRLT